MSVAYQHVREAPVPPSQLDPVVTPDIDAITLKALAKDPADRYQSAREMKADIGRVLAGQQATAMVPRIAEPVPAYDKPTRVVAPVPVSPDQYEDEEPRKSRVGLAVLITALILLILGVGAYAIYQLLQPEVPTVVKVEVPNVVGYKEDQAREQLTARKLVVEVKHENGDEETKDTITAQNPISGTSVDENSTVTITLNDGPKTGKIPSDLVGSDVNDVKKALDNADFTNVNAVEAKSENPDTKPGEVIKISPKEGSTVPLDDEITVTYATGESQVPNFDGLNRAAAIRTANEAGFGEPAFTEKESKKLAGTVISQNPAAGDSVDRDTTIKLVLAKAPPSPPPSTPPPSLRRRANHRRPARDPVEPK